MNKYVIEFVSQCPNDGTNVTYNLIIESKRMILLEDLNDFINENCLTGFHEQMADELFDRFGGCQYMQANHNLGFIETTRKP